MDGKERDREKACSKFACRGAYPIDLRSFNSWHGAMWFYLMKGYGKKIALVIDK